MQCESCARTIRAGSDTCEWCGAPAGTNGDVSRVVTGSETPDRHPVLTDGGEQPPADDPLADPAGEETDDGDDEYLDPEEIVDNGGEEAGDDTAEEPAAGASGGQPGGDQPAGGQPRDGQPAGDQPADGQKQPDADPPPGGGQGQPPESGGQPQQGDRGQPQQAEGQGTDQDPQQGSQPQQGGQGHPPQGGQGQPTQDTGQPQQDSGQQAAGGQGQASGGQQPAQAGQPPAGAGGSGAPAGQPGAPLGGEPGQQQQGDQQEQVTGEAGLVDELKKYPLKLGTALGVLAFLIPYGLLALATFFRYEQAPGENTENLGEVGWQVVEGSDSWSALDVSAELFFYIAELGSGGAVVDLYRRAAGLARPEEVDPGDYPTVEDELDPLLDLLSLNAFPDVPLLLLFIIAPYVLFISARYLARHFTPGDAPFEYAVAGATVTIGTIIVALFLGLLFPVTDFAGRLLFAGILVPGFIGATGGLSIWAFDDHSALVSSLTAWATMVVGIGIGFLLLPLPDLGLPEGTSLSFSLLDRIVLSLGAYLNAAQFNIGSHSQGRLFFLLIVLLTIGAGFVRTWQARDSVADRIDGARVGASIFLGFLATIALLLWVFPMSTVLVDLNLTSTGGLFGPGGDLILGVEGEATDGTGSASIPTIQSVTSVESYLHAILVAGVVFPMTFGALGGYLAVWYRDR